MKLKIFIALLFSSYLSTAQFVHPEGKFYKVNGANLWTEKEGTGDPLFLVSGGPGGSHVGMHSFSPLKDACTLIYIDN